MSERTEKPRRTELIEELCTLLSEDTEEDSSVLQWFQDAKTKKDNNLTSYNPDTPLSVPGSGANRPTCVLPKLLHLLRGCMLSGQWDRALEVLTSVAKSPLGSTYPVWKCGQELMQCDDDENNDDLIRKLYNQMKYLTDMNCQEVILDYLMILLQNGQMENAKEVIQENITLRGLKKETTDRDQYLSMLLKAYTGLVWYVEWKQCQRTVENFRSTVDLESGSLTMSSQTSTVFLEMQMNNYAQKAMSCFQALRGQAGVWDIFIQKYIELLVYNEKHDEALQVLTEYHDTNPDNPCAMRYLYNFYQEHYPESEKTLELLKDLADKLPADPIVLEYCERIMIGSPGTALPHLFKLLDYPCWQTEIRPWKMMAECLTEVLRTTDQDTDTDVVKSYWHCRSTWWPQYHFDSSQIGKKSAKSGLSYYKAVVAGLLCVTDYDFVTTVLETLTDGQEDLQRAIKVVPNDVT